MAKTENDTTAQADGAVKKEKQERRFSVSALRSNCVKLFGCTSSTFDGAFFDSDKSKEYTVEEAKTIIKRWLGKEIK